MKYYKIILLVTLGLSMGMASCTDHEVKDFQTEKPETIIRRDQLNLYADLNSYISSAELPSFKLAAGISMEDFQKGEVLTRAVTRNFDELALTSDEMLHGSLINTSGVYSMMDVEDFMKLAVEKGMGVYGRTLCWNERQNALYLNGLLLPTTIEAENNLVDVSILKSGAFTDWTNVGTDYISVQADGGVKDEGIIISSGTKVPWEISLVSPKIAGEASKDYYLSFYVKVNSPGKLRIYFEKTTNNFPASGLVELKSPDVWQRVYYQIPKLRQDADYFRVLLDFGYVSGVTYAIDATSFTIKEGIVDPNDDSQLIQKEPEEQKAIITDALKDFTETMIAVCTPAVTSWEIATQPLSDAAPYGMKSGKELGVLPDGVFYWQDYIGEDYIGKVAGFAREAFAAAGGNSDDLRLYVSEVNLLDNPEKCASLIHFIEQNEEDTGSKIDGISVELNLTCGVTSIESVRTLFSALAASGKLVRVSVPSVTYRAEGASGDVGTTLTTLQNEEVGKFYAEVVKAYMELVPKAQCGGIVQVNPVDVILSDSKAFNVGLWSQDFSRTPLYEGVVQGISGN